MNVYLIDPSVKKLLQEEENFGIKDGLPPSFTAYLVGLLTFSTLAFQFINIFFFTIKFFMFYLFIDFD